MYQNRNPLIPVLQFLKRYKWSAFRHQVKQNNVNGVIIPTMLWASNLQYQIEKQLDTETCNSSRPQRSLHKYKAANLAHRDWYSSKRA